MSDPTIQEPEQIRQHAARKLRHLQVIDDFQAILGCLLSEDWTTPRLIEMVMTPDSHVLGRCDGESLFKGGASVPPTIYSKASRTRQVGRVRW